MVTYMTAKFQGARSARQVVGETAGAQLRGGAQAWNSAPQSRPPLKVPCQ